MLVLLWVSTAQGQESLADDVQHWALAPFLGTGAYEFDGDQSIYVLETTPRWTWREGSAAGVSPRRPGVDVLLPITLGLRSLDLGDLPGTLDPGNVATLSFVPGVYATLALNPRWTLLGMANLGAGIRLDGEESALIHRLGLRTRYSVGNDRQRWHFIAGVDHFGYHTSRDLDGRMLPLMLAVEWEIAVDAWAGKHGPTHLVTHVAGSHYLDELSLDAIEDAGSQISNDVEIGVAVRPATPFRLWKLSWERIGIAYRRGEGTSGDEDATFQGIRLVFRSLFDQ